MAARNLRTRRAGALPSVSRSQIRADRTAPGGRACTVTDRKTASRILNRLKVGKFLLQSLSPAQCEAFQTIAAGRWAYLRHLEWLEHYDRATQPCRASNPAAVAKVLS